jgi:hypothetical protein
MLMTLTARIIFIVLLIASSGFGESTFKTFLKDNFIFKVGSSGAYGSFDENNKMAAYFTDLHLNFDLRAIKKHFEMGLGLGFPFLNENTPHPSDGDRRFVDISEDINGQLRMTEDSVITRNARQFGVATANAHAAVNVFNVILNVGVCTRVWYSGADQVWKIRQYRRVDTSWVLTTPMQADSGKSVGIIFGNSLRFSLGYQWKRLEFLASYDWGYQNMLGLTVNWRFWD